MGKDNLQIMGTFLATIHDARALQVTKTHIWGRQRLKRLLEGKDFKYLQYRHRLVWRFQSAMDQVLVKEGSRPLRKSIGRVGSIKSDLNSLNTKAMSVAN
jgi:hypothetical protein